MKLALSLVFLTISVIAQQPPAKPEASPVNPTPPSALEYSGVPYFRGIDGALVALQHTNSELRAKFRMSLNFPTGVRMVVGSTTFLIRLDGSGDPALRIKMASVESGGRVPLKNGDLAKEIRIVVKPLGGRLFEVSPATALPEGEYLIMIGGENVLAQPGNFLFRFAAQK